VPGFVGTGEVLGRCTLPSEITKARLGSDEYPLISGVKPLFPFVHAALAAKAMLYGEPYPLKAFLLQEGTLLSICRTPGGHGRLSKV